jgi:hypothetical protein
MPGLRLLAELNTGVRYSNLDKRGSATLTALRLSLKRTGIHPLQQDIRARNELTSARYQARLKPKVKSTLQLIYRPYRYDVQ